MEVNGDHAEQESTSVVPGRATCSENQVLRNFTTHEYVLGSKIKYEITIGHLVLMRICWSTDTLTDIQRGAYLASGR